MSSGYSKRRNTKTGVTQGAAQDFIPGVALLRFGKHHYRSQGLKNHIIVLSTPSLECSQQI